MNQKIYQGNDSCKVIETILKGIGAKKVLLVCGHSFDRQKIYNAVMELPVKLVRFSGFGANPLYEDICKGIDIFNAEMCDTILAIGGGSAIDTAKCIKLFCHMDPSEVYLTQEYKDSGIPLIAIPTTAGTGSESTRHAVCYYKGEKQSISHPSIIPDYAVLEPSLLQNLPIYQKKCTMLDALCQAVESWWSLKSNEESIDYSKSAISLILNNMEAYLEQNNDTAAANIMLGANYAGRAINITATTAAHAMSYKLTSYYNLPHGHAVALCFPEVWEYMNKNLDKCIDERGQDYLQKTLKSIASAFGCASADDAVIWFRQMIQDLGMKFPSGMDRDHELDALAASVNPVRLKNNPVELNREAIRMMYSNIVK